MEPVRLDSHDRLGALQTVQHPNGFIAQLNFLHLVQLFLYPHEVCEASGTPPRHTSIFDDLCWVDFFTLKGVFLF